MPQMITLSIKYDPISPVSVAFARGMEKNLNLDYLKSFIGTTALGASKSSLAAQTQVVSPSAIKTSTVTNKHGSTNRNTSKETTSKTSTPQGPLAKKDYSLQEQ
ncbi:MAG: hypothetical protein EON98_00025 [Chitinophagaceae bacterium]|nr:MAG: hypothetical protein EON98_00025 [Chitinophagaceae bacterium]